MTDRSDADDDDAWEPRGPWIMAIGTALIGAVAVLATGVRAIRKRLQRDGESPNDG